MKMVRSKQTRLELSDVYKIPEEIEAKRILDKNNFYLIDNDFLTVNKPIRDWIFESKEIMVSYFNRKQKADEIKELSFLDGVNHAYNTLFSELAHNSDELETQIINFIIPLIANYCADCKEKIDDMDVS